MLTHVLLIILGFGLLIKGADWLVDGASELARKHNVSDLIIGLTIVAFGTSSPELVVNTFASIRNHPDIVFGNIIGSNNFNLYIILGITGLITPLTIQSSTVRKELPYSFLGVLILFLFTGNFLYPENHTLNRIEGFVLLMLFGFFIIYIYKKIKTDTTNILIQHRNFSSFKIWSLIGIGLIGLIIGGRIVVNSAIKIAMIAEISEKVIGLTIVAAGTSLPELATSVVASLKKNNDIAVGNIIGSNIFNIFFILGISSLIRPIEYKNTFNADLYLLAFGTIFLFIAMFTGEKKKLGRWESGIMLMIYIGYIIYLINI